MAVGWSPAGRKGETTSKSGTFRWYVRTGRAAAPGRGPGGGDGGPSAPGVNSD